MPTDPNQINSTSRTKIEPGIRRDRWSLEAYTRAGGLFRARRFPLDTPLPVLRDWLSDTRNKNRTDKRFRPLRTVGASPLLRKSPAGWCYVYFIESGGHVKIGRAEDVRRRLQQIATDCPTKPILLVAVLAHADLEPLIHSCFAAAKRNGEWFELTPELADYIALLKTGRNPLAPLFGEGVLQS